MYTPHREMRCTLVKIFAHKYTIDIHTIRVNCYHDNYIIIYKPVYGTLRVHIIYSRHCITSLQKSAVKVKFKIQRESAGKFAPAHQQNTKICKKTLAPRNSSQAPMSRQATIKLLGVSGGAAAAMCAARAVRWWQRRWWLWLWLWLHGCRTTG